MHLLNIILYLLYVVSFSDIGIFTVFFPLMFIILIVIFIKLTSYLFHNQLPIGPSKQSSVAKSLMKSMHVSIIEQSYRWTD